MPAWARTGALIVFAASPLICPVTYIEIYSFGDDSMYVRPMLPALLMSMAGKKVDTPGPGSMTPVWSTRGMLVGLEASVLNTYQWVFATRLKSTADVFAATRMLSRQATLKTRK